MADIQNPYMPSGLDRLSALLMAVGAGMNNAAMSGRSGWEGLGQGAMAYGQANAQAQQHAAQWDQWNQQQQTQEGYRRAQEENLRSQVTARDAEAKNKVAMGQAVLAALPPPGMTTPTAPPTMGPGADILSRSGGAIAGIESAGQADPYQAIGPQTPMGRANGKYQVMDFNVGPWTQEVLGTAMTPDQFRASPPAQEAVFKAKFGQALQKYGNPQDAASWWFSGKPLAGNTAGPDVNGTTVAGYVNKFNRGMYGGNGPAGGEGVIPVQARGAAPPNAQPQGGDTRSPAAPEPQLDQQTMDMIRAIAIKDPEAAAKLLITARQGLKKDDAYYPLSQDDAKMFLGTAYDPTKAYQRNRVTGKIDPIGGSLVNIQNTQESEITKAIAKQDADRLLKIQENATSVNDTANKVRLATDLFKQTYTGTGGDAANFFFRTLGSLGVESAAGKANAAAAATALINEVTPRMRAPGSGATSDFEMRAFAAALPSMINLPNGNEMIATYWQRIADRALAVQTIAEKHVGESKALTGTKYAEEVKALGPLFSKDEIKAMQEMAKAKPAATGERPPIESFGKPSSSSEERPPLSTFEVK